MKLKKGKK